MSARSRAPRSYLVVNPNIGVKSVKDLIALAKRSRARSLFGSAGIGSGTHMGGEQFKFAAGINVGARPLPWNSRSPGRHGGGARSILAVSHGSGGGVHQGRPRAGPGSDHRAALARVSGRADHRGIRAARVRLTTRGTGYSRRVGRRAPPSRRSTRPFPASSNLPELKKNMLVQGVVLKSSSPEQFIKLVTRTSASCGRSCRRRASRWTSP